MLCLLLLRDNSNAFQSSLNAKFASGEESYLSQKSGTLLSSHSVRTWIACVSPSSIYILPVNATK